MGIFGECAISGRATTGEKHHQHCRLSQCGISGKSVLRTLLDVARLLPLEDISPKLPAVEDVCEVYEKPS